MNLLKILNSTICHVYREFAAIHKGLFEAMQWYNMYQSKEQLKNISPFNNRTEMPTALFVVKKYLTFWVCYIAGLFLAEGAVILLHFAFGKNMLVGDALEPKTITLIIYYGYIVMVGQRDRAKTEMILRKSL